MVATVRLTIPAGGGIPGPPVVGRYKVNACTQKYKSEDLIAASINNYDSATVNKSYQRTLIDDYMDKILRAHEFEEHAGGKTRHPNNYIYLENGKLVYSIIQAMKNSPLNTVDESIRNVVGSSVNEEFLQVWKVVKPGSKGVHSVVLNEVGLSKHGQDSHSSNALRLKLEKLVDRIKFLEAKRANLSNGNPDSKQVLEGDDDVDVHVRRNLMKKTKALKLKLRKSILKEAETVITTLSGCGGDLYSVCSESMSTHKFSSSSESSLFGAVVIDEAAQALEPSTLIPLQLSGGVFNSLKSSNQVTVTDIKHDDISRQFTKNRNKANRHDEQRKRFSNDSGLGVEKEKKKATKQYDSSSAVEKKRNDEDGVTREKGGNMGVDKKKERRK
uniref:DNA2/NAM7 helicase helicase domain-containing protein n=1 Tax=Lactuca sativa TaxID=4236 RepID=A0A9R1V1M1_LACSA|nr:hypothetical protein LSAT_V11C700352410 [Lactuca sativa]